MFVRWKRRKKAQKRPGQYGPPRCRSENGDSLYCVIAESKRVKGSPRQKVICYLGSVDEGDTERLCVRVDFWDHVVANLDRLRLVPAERTKIEGSINRVVSRPTDDEATQFRKERKAFMESSGKAFRVLLTQHHRRGVVVPKVGNRSQILGTTMPAMGQVQR